MDKLSEMKAELAALDAQKRERESAREQAEEERKLRDEIRARKLELARLDAIERAEEELGELDVDFCVVETFEDVVVVKKPHPAVYKKWRDKGRYKSADLYELIKPCIHSPSASEFHALAEKYPGLLDELADNVMRLAHGRAKEVAGK